MKITRITPILIEVRLKIDGAVPMASGEARRSLHTLLVKVDTDEGLTGYGEAFALNGGRATHAAVEHVVAPRCVGRDAADIVGLNRDLYRRLYNCGRSGPVVYAISGVDIALWDIAAKRAGVPLYRLLGKERCTSLPAYASLLRYGDPQVIRQQVQQALDRGYRVIKLHENEFDNIEAARDVAGDGVPLLVDCTCPWDLEQAVAMSKLLDPLGITWLEEPLYPPDDHAGLAKLRAASPIPIAAGENVSNVYEFERLLAVRALDYAQPSVTKMGGVSELRKVFELAAGNNVKVVPHSPYFGPGFLASLHVCAAFGERVWIERYYCDFETHPFGSVIDPCNGDIMLPQIPGLGLDPDAAVVERLRVV